MYRNDRVLVGVYLGVVDREFEPSSGQTKDYEIGICCFSAKQAELRNKSKDWLARKQNNVFERRDMSTSRLFKCCFSELKHYKNLTRHVGLVQDPHHHLIQNVTDCRLYIMSFLSLFKYSWLVGLVTNNLQKSRLHTLKKSKQP